MNTNKHHVYPLRRIAASIYDFFLLLGVWFLVGSIALFLNDREILNPILGLVLVLISSWAFYSFFWIRGGKTLGMAVWNIQIFHKEDRPISLKETSIRFFLNLFIVSLAGLPLFQIYFSKDGETIADKYSKTILKKI